MVYWFSVLCSPLSELLSLLLDITGTRSSLKRGRLDCPLSSHAHTGARTLSLPSSWSLVLPTETCLGQLEGPQLSLLSPGFSFEMLFFSCCCINSSLRASPSRCQSRFNAWYWMLGASALGRPRGMVWGGRREEGSGWGAHVYLWWIHFDIWQN